MSIEAINNELGKMDFLNLLAIQLSHQDPMDPVDNSEFIAQLAQFSALEASENTYQAVLDMASQETQVFATALLGRTVSGIDATTNTLFTGQVTGISFTQDNPVVYVDGNPVSLSDITTVS